MLIGLFVLFCNELRALACELDYYWPRSEACGVTHRSLFDKYEYQ